MISKPQISRANYFLPRGLSLLEFTLFQKTKMIGMMNIGHEDSIEFYGSARPSSIFDRRKISKDIRSYMEDGRIMVNGVPVLPTESPDQLWSGLLNKMVAKNMVNQCVDKPGKYRLCPPPGVPFQVPLPISSAGCPPKSAAHSPENRRRTRIRSRTSSSWPTRTTPPTLPESRS